MKSALELNHNFSRASLLLAKIYLALGDIQKAKLNASTALKNAQDQEVASEAQSILQMK